MTQTKCACEINADKELQYHDLVKDGTLTLNNLEKDQTMDVALLTCNKCQTKWKYTWDDSYQHIIIEWTKFRA